MAQQYNLHQEANTLDMASLTDEIVLSADTVGGPGDAARVQISTSRLHNPGTPGQLAQRPGLRLDADLTVAQEMALLDWLADSLAEEGYAVDDLASLSSLREALAPLLAGLPEKLKEHLERLMALDREVEAREVRASARRPSTRTSGRSSRSRCAGCCGPSAERPGPAARPPRVGSSTGPGRCGPTCATTGSRSGRSR